MGDNVVLTEQSTSTWSGDENSAKPISVEKLSGSGDISISFTDGTRALYIKSISVTYTESSEPQKTVKSLAITGEPTNKEYFVGDAFSTDGLKVNATYDDDTQEDVTAKATWTRTPATFTEAGAVSVTATATFSGVSAETTCPVTVKTIANTKEGAYTVEQAIALIDAGKDLATPVYVKGIVSEITTPYSTQYKNISFNVSDDGATTTPQFQFFRNQKDAENTYAEDPKIEVGATVIGYGILKKFNDTYEFDKGNYLVEYKAPAAKTLQSIAISGTPQTEYTEGETFSTDGLVVTATYDDASTAVVTDDATWSFEPATLAASTTSVTATATYNEKTASETYNVTVKEIPSYTYTWMVNGAEVKKSVLKAGAAVEAPANPENIDGKVFTGWVTTATVDANVAPTYATIDATAKANTTYYAVFATLKQGAGEKWVKKTASEITEGGVYALITEDGKAFNGEISGSYRGDGQSTVTAFEFVNNEATSAPEGTCELTFEKSEKAETDGNEGYNMINKATGKFLTSMDNSQGNLTWSVLEDSYWYSNNGWIFKKNNTHLRVFFNSENIPTFRTYPSTSGTEMYFAQKVAGAGYADFTTIVKAAVTTLANLAENGAEGAAYQVNDEMVVAKKFQAGNKNYIVVKDAAKAVRNFSTPAADDKSFNINGNKQEKYAQNNWMLVSLPVELYNQVNEKTTVTSITGSLTEKFNVAMEATNVVFENATNDFAPNTYCPINFMGESSVKGTNQAYTSSYYFATPKANEYANVVWAVYNGTDGAFYLPSNNGSINVQGFKAAFNVDYSLNSVDNPKLTSGNVYSFEALVKEVAVPTTDAKSTSDASTKFVVYPLDLDADKVATGVNDVNSAKEVKGVSYFNMMGVESAQPFDGVNIMVTTYTDGTSSAAKVLR
ncbi:MAG: bacterial Ig-like domain-containing protein [Bacteroidales bacterium]|nr:bacterial Ig-like domain-containing protein [Bacteroidales bacterium]MDY2710963.1 bacterial Ig-like domain-containing protein [Sodaliphilus sp.]